MNLLFIEDDSRFFDWLVESLNGDHTCTQAKSIREAERILDGGKFDAVFADLMMPGPDTPESIVSRARAACDVPLIILTGREMRADLANICDGFLFKDNLHPHDEIPAAVEFYSRQRESKHPYDKTAQLFNALRALPA